MIKEMTKIFVRKCKAIIFFKIKTFNKTMTRSMTMDKRGMTDLLFFLFLSFLFNLGF